MLDLSKTRVLGLALTLVAGLVLIGIVAISWFAADNAIHWIWKGVEPLGQLHLPAPEVVTFLTTDGLRLEGWFIAGDTPATVILAHGRGGNRADMLNHANYLHREGFSTLLFDFRYFGESEGSASTFGAREPLDIEAAVAYLQTRPDVDSGRIGVQGVSLGAASGIMAAARMPAVRGVVAEASFDSVPHVLDFTFPQLIGLPTFPFARVTKWIVELRLSVDLDKMSPRNAIADISPRPVLLIEDGDDELFPPDSGERLYQAARDPKERWRINGAAHGRGWQTDPHEYELRVVRFWKQVFGLTQ